MDVDPVRGSAAKIETSALDLLVANRRAAACLLQCAWRAHLVRCMLWRQKKVRRFTHWQSRISMLSLC